MSRYEINEKGDRIKQSIVLTFCFLVLLSSLFYGIPLLLKKDESEKKQSFSACSLSARETANLLHAEEIEAEFALNDYLFYGETLSLFEKTYSLENRDDIVGRNLILVNLCSKESILAPSYYLVTSEIDNRIPLETLENGFYAISVAYNMKTYRAYSTDVKKEVFYTVRRNGEMKKITLIADAALLGPEEKNRLERNWYYLKVEDATDQEEIYDIVLDPAYHYDGGDSLEIGPTINGINKTAETLEMAKRVKEKLEEKGLRVLISRNDEEKVLAYGINGRLHRAYQSKAKYLIELQLSSAKSERIKGCVIDYSGFSSNRLASVILRHMVNEAGLHPQGGTNVPGLSESGRVGVYEGRMMLRESGGRILGAGTFSEKAELNASFAKDSIFGMQALTLEYLYMTNPEEAEYWLNNKDKIAEATANALLDYLGVK